MSNLIHIILDKSGSMSLIVEATISGFNEFLQTQKKEAPDAFLGLTLFDTDFREKWNNVPVRDASPLTHVDYQPGGNTALYDAIGRTIRSIEALPEQPERVVIAIITDGQENSSREWDQRKIFDLIQWHRDEGKGWEFQFVGADQDSYAVGGAMGIPASHISNYGATPVGAATAFASMARSTSGYASGVTADAAYTDEEKAAMEATVTSGTSKVPTATVSPK